jgi:hypothetical protein
MKAVRTDNVQQLRDWARYGALITSETPLHVAILEGRLNVVKCMVRDFAVDVYQELQHPQQNLNDLCIAVEYGNIGMIQFLVKELGQTSTEETMVVSFPYMCQSVKATLTQFTNWLRCSVLTSNK